jgi:hypothetical protein
MSNRPVQFILGTRSSVNYKVTGSYFESIHWVERKVFAFSKRWRKHKLSRSFYKAGIEKLVTCWETVIASNGNYVID